MGVLRRVRNLWRRDRLDAEIEEELRSHVEMAVEDAVRAGTPPQEARRSARLRFGDPLATRERTVEADAVTALGSLARDLRDALRRLRRSPGFTTTAVITLALGIGATTAIFTLVQQVMLRSLPVAQPEQLWRIGRDVSCCYSTRYNQDDWNLFSWEAYRYFRAGTPGFENLAAFQIGVGNAELAVRRAGSPAPAQTGIGEYVSGNFFDTLGISAWRGRLFTDADDQDGAPPAAVMSFHTWQQQYGSDPSVIGATYQFNGHAFTIVGITPPGFFGAKVAASDMPDFWMPLTTEPLIAGGTSRLRNPRLAWLNLIGRIRSGTNPKTLEAQLQVELHQWLGSHVGDMTPHERALWQTQSLHLTPGGAGVSLMREEYEKDLWLLLLAALCVLLVACANIANLLLARGMKDRPQTALLAALGASRARLVLKALVESLTLAVFGAVAGIAVAYAGARLILHLAIIGPEWIPVDAHPSIPVLLFALGLSLLTGVAFGIAPAWMTARADPIEALHGASRSTGGNRYWAPKMLVIVQAAVSVVLLSAAAMLGQSLSNLKHQNFGFDSSGRYLVSIDTKTSNYRQDQLVPLYQEIEERLRSFPDVHSVGSVLEAPMAGWVWPHDIRIEGKPEPGLKEDDSSGWTRVTPGFFETLGDQIVMGRPIAEEDNATTRPVAVINEAFAKKFFGKENPIGQHFGPTPRKNAGMYEIVGVARDVVFAGNAEPMYFLPEAQRTEFDEPESEEREVWSHYLYNTVIWAPGNPPGLEARVRKALADIDPHLLVSGVRPYSEVIDAVFAQQDMMASLMWLFGALGLVLAAVGLYGVTAYGVEQRTSEIGVRMALGADRGSVVAMVLRGAFWQVGIGLALGIPAAIGAGYLIANRLFGVTPWDPLMLLGSTVLLGLAALIAAFIPARRAASADPVRALRSE
ncbi:MAG TPA: ABC transporter permease [Bryobacteraceae bacterium]|nr:ABC transporter permease [Bryobacteraceae bacterium]